MHILTGGSEHIYCVRFSPDGQWLASGGREKGAARTFFKQLFGHLLLRVDPTVRLWRVRDGRLQQAIAEHTDDAWSLAFSPDGRWFASAGADRQVKLFGLTAAR